MKIKIAFMIAFSISMFAIVCMADVPKESAECVSCHKTTTPGLVGEWEASRHSENGVACLDCHNADPKDPDAFQHHGATIATIVTPKDCANCHEDEVKQNTESHHAQAAKFVGSLDNILGEIVEGPLAAANGCRQCHGSEVAFLKDASGSIQRNSEGKPLLDPMTWPNTGIGRINMDGSLGSCTACHSRHSFSSEQARYPDTCGKCHMGPDHPQKEIYDESKHGIAFRALQSRMNMSGPTWVVGKDYTTAPTCSTCHMGATSTQKVTHDVGARISWTLRPVISKKLENADARRGSMKEVCSNCHGLDFVDAFYKQFDATVGLYNEKFAKPAQDIMDILHARNKLSPTPFDDEIEWTFYKLWHHQGRRARMGASMQGPDYTQWHGFFEVAECFYFEFIPQARELAKHDPKITKMIDKVMSSPEHSWKKGLTKDDIQKIQDFYKQRYGD